MKPYILAVVTALASLPARADPIADKAAAVRLYQTQSWADAAAAFATLALANPDDGALSYYLGVSLAHAGRCAEARPILAQAFAAGALGSRPSLRRALVEAAACAAQAGDADAALSDLQRARDRYGFEDFGVLHRDSRFARIISNSRFAVLAGRQPPPSDRTAGWRSDLDAFVALVEARHPSPFHNVSAVAWRRAVNVLRADVPSLTDIQIIGRFMQLGRLIGDGHTSVLPPLEGARAFHLLPIWPYELDGQWFVAAAAPDHADLVGARITAINGVAVTQVMERLGAMIPADNAVTQRWTGAIGLQFAEIAALTVNARDNVHIELTVEQDGASREVALAGTPIDRDPTTRWAPEGWPTMSGAHAPLWLAHANAPFWIEDLPNGVLYAQVNQIADGEQESLQHFAERLGNHLQSPEVRALVLDLRHNNGGSGGLNWLIVRELVRASALDREGALYVVIGRRTFSAAMNLASMIETHTNAIFVGEPTGSRPNFYGEDTPFRLPYSGLSGSISSAWFQGGTTSDDLRPWIAPDLPAPLTAADLRAGRDPALAAVAAHLQTLH